MLKSYFIIAYRNLKNNLVYTLTSVTGLSFGIACSILIALYVNDELSYDKYHEHSKDIYRLTSILHFNGDLKVALSSMACGPTLAKDYPEVETYLRFRKVGNNVQAKVGKVVYNESNFWFCDSTLFDVFSYDILAGKPDEALKAPNSVVLTEDIAIKYFGNTDCVGQSFKVNNSVLNVTAVIANPPNHSEIKADALISMNTMPEQTQEVFNQDWFRVGFYTFLLFNREIDKADFVEKLADFEKRYVQPWSEVNGIEAGHSFDITALEDLHFDTRHDYDQPKGNMAYITIFIALAVFIIVIASVNYINLTLAQGTGRAVEVGIRKTIGGSRREIRAQHLIESLVIAFISAFFSLILLNFFLEPFNDISGKEIYVNAVFQPEILLVLFGLILLIGLIAGAYPAFFLSGLSPTRVLKGDLGGHSDIGSFRKALVLIQFTVSIFMILGTILINDQMTYLNNLNLGFDKDNIITLQLPADTTLNSRLDAFINELKSETAIDAVCRSGMPTGGSGELMFRIEQDGKLMERTVKTIFVDDGFVDVLGLELLLGRNFSREFSTDAQEAFLVNMESVKAFGWHEEPLGKRIQWGLMPNGQAANDGKVVGVVNDFNFLTLHNPLEPLIICFNQGGSNNLSLRLNASDPSAALQLVKDKWESFIEEYPFDPRFLSRQIENNYNNERNMKDIFRFFAIVSILIACIGLYALLSYAIENRRKEIGIRKVLGAGAWHITSLIARDFLIILLIAFLIATPVSYFGMQEWLRDFAYQTPVMISSYLISLFIVLLLYAFLVSVQTYRIANENPVDSLRNE